VSRFISLGIKFPCNSRKKINILIIFNQILQYRFKEISFTAHWIYLININDIKLFLLIVFLNIHFNLSQLQMLPSLKLCFLFTQIIFRFLYPLLFKCLSFILNLLYFEISFIDLFLVVGINIFIHNLNFRQSFKLYLSDIF